MEKGLKDRSRKEVMRARDGREGGQFSVALFAESLYPPVFPIMLALIPC
jgi:hypothetical protein